MNTLSTKSPQLLPRILSKVLTVSLITLLILSPALGIWAITWQWHTQLSTQPALGLSATSQGRSLDQTSPSLDQARSLLATQASTASSKPRVVDRLLTRPILFLPLSLCVAILLYKGHRLYRFLLFKTRVARLERLWQKTILE